MNNTKRLECPELKPRECQELVQEKGWISDARNSLTTTEELALNNLIKADEKSALKQVVKKYHLRVPLYYLSLIKDPANNDDPIRKQCIPSLAERNHNGCEAVDPLGEIKTSPVPCLVHRYPDRVLLLVTGKCFMYCRHCTRKRLWQDEHSEPSLKDIEAALNYVKANKQIREVVVSGGDPLTLATERLDYILSSIAKINHVEAIRLGTRAPVVMPSRIDDQLCASLEKYDNLWINVQFNHPREITKQSSEACRKLQKRGIPLSNQSVLLKGINDDVKTMVELCQKLQSIRVRPYYLFQCDPVVGAAHFRTSLLKGIEIIEKMRGHTGGMCVPSFVVDGTEGKGKVPLSPNYLLSLSEQGAVLRNYKDEIFFYRGGPHEQTK